MATSIILLADDLSGALDSAAPFRTAGQEVAVAIDMAAMAVAAQRAPHVLAVNLDCRTLDSDTAAARVRSLAPAIATLAPHLVFLKLDSRLKGPVSALVEAAMAASGRQRAIVCPAIPELGRFVIDGVVIGRGIDRPIAVAECMPDDPAIVCRDAGDQATLHDIAGVILDDPGTVLAVGARGLAQALAELAAPGCAAAYLHDALHLPIVFAIGSRDPITSRQVERLLQSVSMTDERPVRSRPVVLVRPPAGLADPHDIAARLAEDVARLVDARPDATIVASGGDTAMAVARRLGVNVLVPRHELLPGVPISDAPDKPGIRIATKSGGFGDPETLVACLAAMTRRAGLEICDSGLSA